MRGFLFLFLPLAALTSVEPQGGEFDLAKLAGRWSGTGAFFKAELREKLGEIAFDAEFRPDTTASGRVGDATWESVRVRKVRDLIEVQARIKGRIGGDPALAKDHLVLLVTALSDSTMRAEYHLKSNAFFDFRMREGSVVLVLARAR